MAGPRNSLFPRSGTSREQGVEPHFRQLLHVGYKIAAKMGARYLDALDACEASISRNVTENLYARHLQPIFLGQNSATP